MMRILFTLLLIRLTNGEESYKFPDDFVFGVATASYQIEGAWNISGKGENIWDRLTHDHPDWIEDRSNGDIACDSYHKYKEDVQLLKDLNVDFYRFSISWSRILPTGFTNDINKDGIRYYNDLIDELLSHNITPMVTIYHWDLPQPLQEIGGWANIELVQLFEDYSRVLFENFGDRVKIWITFNEPAEVCQSGYGAGDKAPAYRLDGIATYMCARTLLLSHAKVYHLYQNEFKNTQKGTIGITMSAKWYEPKSNDPNDIEMAERALQMTLGWYTHPIFSKTGDYPEIMKQRIEANSKLENFPRTRLPPFSEDEINMLRNSADFFGLNYYTSRIASIGEVDYPVPSYRKDIGGISYNDPNWGNSSADWLKVAPFGLRKLLKWIKKEYDNPLVYITENGYADSGEIEDTDRINYYKAHLIELLKAINLDGCNVQGFTAWSLLDNFEWREGYSQTFGLYKVDFDDPNRRRQPKSSVGFYKNIISQRFI